MFINSVHIHPPSFIKSVLILRVISFGVPAKTSNAFLIPTTRLLSPSVLSSMWSTLYCLVKSGIYDALLYTVFPSLLFLPPR